MTTTEYTTSTVTTTAAAFGWTQDGPAFHTANHNDVVIDEAYRYQVIPGAYDEGVFVGSYGDYEVGEAKHTEREANGLNKSLLNLFGNGKTVGEDVTFIQFRKANRYEIDQIVIVVLDERGSDIIGWLYADTGESYDDGRVAVMSSSKSLATHGEYLQGLGVNQRWLLGSLVDQFATVQ